MSNKQENSSPKARAQLILMKKLDGKDFILKSVTDNNGSVMGWNVHVKGKGDVFYSVRSLLKGGHEGNSLTGKVNNYRNGR